MDNVSKTLMGMIAAERAMEREALAEQERIRESET